MYAKAKFYVQKRTFCCTTCTYLGCFNGAALNKNPNNLKSNDKFMVRNLTICNSYLLLYSLKRIQT